MTAQNQSTFQNENLQVILKKEPGCKIHLDVTVTPAATEACYHNAFAQIRKDISIPGFRKGKAPEAMISQKYATYIEKEWKDILLNTSLDEAIRLTKIFPLNNNSVKSASIKSSSRQDGSTLSFEYEAAPEVPSIDPETLSFPKVALKTTTQKDVDAAIEELTLQSAEWNDVTDRPVEEGDYVEIDIDDIGEAPKNICTNTSFFVKKSKMGGWMRKLLIGMTPGQTAEAMSEKDKDEDEEDCQACEDGTHTHPEFIPTLCRITLHSIKQAKPHPLNDDLAKKYGVENSEILVERVKLSLENRAAEEQKNHKRDLVKQLLVKNYPFDIPASLVQDELKGIKKQIIDDLRTDGVDESQIQAEANKIEQEFYAKRYDYDYRLYFLTQKFARENNIKVENDEISMEMMRQMWQEQMGQSPKSHLDSKERMNQIQLQLLITKSLDQIIAQVEKTT